MSLLLLLATTNCCYLVITFPNLEFPLVKVRLYKLPTQVVLKGIKPLSKSSKGG
ncbi:hypothetical protein [Nostoc sp.]|uniref:hypothetical protein n=1 Tax=Nostoc sp. TaxID=1180 RepID=UPI002FF8CE5D